jgi:hypothetical protein
MPSLGGGMGVGPGGSGAHGGGQLGLCQRLRSCSGNLSDLGGMGDFVDGDDGLSEPTSSST